MNQPKRRRPKTRREAVISRCKEVFFTANFRQTPNDGRAQRAHLARETWSHSTVEIISTVGTSPVV